MGASIEVGLDQASLAALKRGLDSLTDTQPLMETIASFVEGSSKQRFVTQRGPDGKPWKPSIRAQLQNDKTLYKTGLLEMSIHSRATATVATVSDHVVYAGIHQFGGTIRQQLKSGTVREFTMPARPFLGVDENDRVEIAGIVQEFVDSCFDR